MQLFVENFVLQDVSFIPNDAWIETCSSFSPKEVFTALLKLVIIIIINVACPALQSSSNERKIRMNVRSVVSFPNSKSQLIITRGCFSFNFLQFIQFYFSFFSFSAVVDVVVDDDAAALLSIINETCLTGFSSLPFDSHDVFKASPLLDRWSFFGSLCYQFSSVNFYSFTIFIPNNVLLV